MSDLSEKGQRKQFSTHLKEIKANKTIKMPEASFFEYRSCEIIRKVRVKLEEVLAAHVQLGGPGSDPPRDRLSALNSPVTHKLQPRGKDSGTGKTSRGPRKWLTHHRAVNVASGMSRAHLENPGAQQVGVGAVGRSVGAHGAESQKHQQQGGAQEVGPGTHG